MSTTLKRHCMVVHAYYPIGEPRVQREAEALTDSGYEVDVICLRQPGEPAHATVHGVNVYRLPVRRHKGRGVPVQLLEYMIFFALALWRVGGRVSCVLAAKASGRRMGIGLNIENFAHRCIATRDAIRSHHVQCTPW